MKPTAKQTKELTRLKKLDPGLEYSWNEKVGVPLRLRGALAGPQTGEPEAAALKFFEGLRELYDFTAPAEELKLVESSTDKAGNKHLKYQQMFKNVPVFGHELRVHLDNQNAVKGLNGRYMSKIQIPDKAVITADKAISIALAHDSKNKKDRLKRAAKLVIIIIDTKTPSLAWQVVVEGEDKALDGGFLPATWNYFIDSQQGAFIWRFNNEPTHTYTVGTGTGKYSGAHNINTMHDHGAGNYKLEDGATSTGVKIVTHDADGGFPPSPISEDSNNNWNGANQGEEVDCHYYTRIVFDYYLVNHGRNSYDNAGAEMHIYAHVGSSWNNASWNGSYVKIGDGNTTDNDSLCTLDIIAHEWTHAVTQFTADLVYNSQSGALNESMSDVFAALIDGDWLQGEDCWLRTSAPAGRNLEDPTNGGLYNPADPITSVLAGHQPDHMNDIYAGSADYGGVHINSGIMNKAAYLIATGGTHRGITVCEGLSRQVLGELYYHALTNHLTSSSDFADMKDAVLDSLHDLYLGDARYARWRASIINAFAAVGIGSAVLCPITCWVLPHICPPSPHFHCPPAPHGICPPSPHIICPPSPHLTCPPSPHLLCPPSPHLLCPPSPILCHPGPIIGCLPGPDPVFDPDIVTLPPDLILDKIPQIDKKHLEVLKQLEIVKVSDFVTATSTPNKIAKLSRTTGIAVSVLNELRVKALKLIKS